MPDCVAGWTRRLRAAGRQSPFRRSKLSRRSKAPLRCRCTRPRMNPQETLQIARTRIWKRRSRSSCCRTRYQDRGRAGSFCRHIAACPQRMYNAPAGDRRGRDRCSGPWCNPAFRPGASFAPRRPLPNKQQPPRPGPKRRLSCFFLAAWFSHYAPRHCRKERAAAVYPGKGPAAALLPGRYCARIIAK